MIKSIDINEKLEKYISDHSYDLHPIQKEILNYNNTLGNLKKMQISVTQAYFFQLLIKTNNIKNILEIGTFTGYSALSMGLSISNEIKLRPISRRRRNSTMSSHCVAARIALLLHWGGVGLER